MIWEVAKREILTRGRTRAFRIITAILLVLAIAAPIAVRLWPDDGPDTREVTVGVDDDFESEAGLEQLEASADLVGESFSREIDFDFVASSVALEERLADGEIDVGIENVGGEGEGPGRLVFEKDRDQLVEFALGAVLTQRRQIQEAAELGLTDEELGRLLGAGPTESRLLEPVDPDEEEGEAVQIVLAIVGLLSAFLLPQIFGQLTMMGVVEEKSTRVVEVLLAQVRPRTLLAGKLLGTCLLAMVQLGIVVAGLAAAVAVTTSISVPVSAWRFIPIMAVALVGGLIGYTTLFALLGSLISRQEDASQVMLPVFLPLMGGYIVGQTAIAGTADSLLARVLTYIPLTSPMLLPVRVARDAIEPWEIALSLGLMLIGTWLLFRLTVRVYELTILHTGSRIKLKDLRARMANS